MSGMVLFVKRIFQADKVYYRVFEILIIFHREKAFRPLGPIPVLKRKLAPKRAGPFAGIHRLYNNHNFAFGTIVFLPALFPYQ
jgi:hypothetical protein